jgi:hypothetical protein
VSIADQFGNPAAVFGLRKPRHLYTPVDAGSPVENPNAYLVCYLARRVAAAPRHVPVSSVHLHDGFASEEVATKREDLLCVPSVKGP